MFSNKIYFLEKNSFGNIRIITKMLFILFQKKITSKFKTDRTDKYKIKNTCRMVPLFK